MIVALVIAKGGSRRLPKKNTLPFAGLPLCEWTIIQATCSRQIDKTYVSTDSEKIAELTEKHGAHVIWRDYEQKPDDSGKIVYMHALSKMPKIDLLAPLLPTAVLRKPDDLDRGIGIWFELARKGIHVMEMPDCAPHKETLLYRLRGGKYRNLYLDKFGNAGTGGFLCAFLQPEKWLDYQKKQSLSRADSLQDKKYHDNKVVSWWSRVPPHYKKWRYYWPIEPWQCHDIDYETQFFFIELLFKHFILKGRGPEVYYEYRDAQKEALSNVSERHSANSERNN